MSKIFWMDTETTGLNATRNDIVKIAYLIEIDGVIMEEREVSMRPAAPEHIELEALRINKLTREEVMRYPPLEMGVAQIAASCERYCDRFDKNDKFVIAGYNVGFDDQFLRATFLKAKHQYYGSYFFWPKLDVQTSVADAIIEGLRCSDYKLATVCAYHDIKFKPHDALEDIKATKTLYDCLTAYCGEPYAYPKQKN